MDRVFAFFAQLFNFPTRVKTISELENILLLKGVKKIVITPAHAVLDDEISTVQRHAYRVIVNATTNDDARLKVDVLINTELFLGYSDGSARGAAAMRLLLTANEYRERLMEKYPDAQIVVETNGEPLVGTKLEKLKREANVAGVIAVELK